MSLSIRKQISEKENKPQENFTKKSLVRQSSWINRSSDKDRENTTSSKPKKLQHPTRTHPPNLRKTESLPEMSP